MDMRHADLYLKFLREHGDGHEYWIGVVVKSFQKDGIKFQNREFVVFCGSDIDNKYDVEKPPSTDDVDH
jgi:hypothetical protein